MPLGDGNLHRLLVGIEDNDDVPPVVTPRIVLQAIGHHTFRRIEEAQMLTHQVGIPQTEGWMILTQLDELLIIVEYLRVFLFVCPVKVVDTVGRLEAVVYAQFGAQQFLTREHEGYALRGEDSRLCQQVKLDELLFSQTRNAGPQTVSETHIVVTGHIRHHLCRLHSPRLLRVVDLRHIHLRMGNATCNTELQTLLAVRDTRQETSLRIVIKRSAQGITDLIAEGGNARHLRDIRLHAQLVSGQTAGTSTPSLPINKYGGVYLVDSLSDQVHRLNIMATHQVKAEAIDVILVDPVFHRLDHELTHHRLLRGRLIATAGAVAWFPVSRKPIVIVWIGPLEVGVLDIVGMVIHHVEDDADARLVEGLHHLLEFADAHLGLVGIGRIATLGHVVVHGVVAPVVLRNAEPRLVHRAIVIAGQDVDGVHAEFFQVADGPGLCQCEELARILRLRAGDGEVAVVHLIDHDVSG